MPIVLNCTDSSITITAVTFPFIYFHLNIFFSFVLQKLSPLFYVRLEWKYSTVQYSTVQYSIILFYFIRNTIPKTSILVFLRMALARQRSCLCPTLRFSPFSWTSLNIKIIIQKEYTRYL